MRGLILKDIYAIKIFGKQYGITMLFMIGYAFIMKQSSFLYIYAVLLGSMTIISLMSLDESVSFNRFALTMPVSVEMLVKAKYLIFIMTTVIGTVFSLLIINLSKMIFPFQLFAEFNWRELMPPLMIFVIGTSSVIPVMFKKGVEKGRYTYIAVMLGMGAIIYVGAKITEKFNISFEWMATVPGALYGVIFLTVVIITLVISYLISIRLVKDKQW